jgi:hypothetical protein
MHLFIYIYMTSISGEEAVEPATISESNSPIAFKFWHNVAFKYAGFLIYGMGRESIGCDGTGWDAMGRDGTEPQQHVAGYN